MTQKTILWFRQDLRLDDHPALFEAAALGPVLPIYILEDTPGALRLGAASQVALHYALASLDASLNGNLHLYRGCPQTLLERLIQTHDIDAVYWSRCYEPQAIARDTQIKEALKNMGVLCKSFNASLLWEPWNVLKADGTPYRVFTPFYRKGCLLAAPPRALVSRPPVLETFTDTSSLKLSELQLLPQIPWHLSFSETQACGEDHAHRKMEAFLSDSILDYKDHRNFPSQKACSGLSTELHFGILSPHQLWWSIQQSSTLKKSDPSVDHFLSELGWREFSYALLYHFPTLPEKNFQATFDAFPWTWDASLIQPWSRGQTGVPFVDAGMRELWKTGHMHNRVRMVVASFLVKNLMVHWRAGADWFWDALTDADLANNSASWQWVAGSGADAAPYFRIFNPVTQGESFDPEGNYTRHYVPELKRLPLRYLFKPWEAPRATLEAAGITLGKDYPHPMVDLKASRERALNAFKDLRSGTG